jgi:hypothetical protein
VKSLQLLRPSREMSVGWRPILGGAKSGFLLPLFVALACVPVWANAAQIQRAQSSMVPSTSFWHYAIGAEDGQSTEVRVRRQPHANWRMARQDRVMCLTSVGATTMFAFTSLQSAAGLVCTGRGWQAARHGISLCRPVLAYYCNTRARAERISCQPVESGWTGGQHRTCNLQGNARAPEQRRRHRPILPHPGAGGRWQCGSIHTATAACSSRHRSVSGLVCDQMWAAASGRDVEASDVAAPYGLAQSISAP